MIEWEQLKDMIKKPEPKKRVSIVSLCMVREERALYGMERFTGSRQAVETVRPLFALSDREMVAVMSLDTLLRPIAAEVVAVGGLNKCYVDIGNIFKHAILSNARCVICFHNHLTGNCTPSPEDCVLTNRIWEAGNILGISLEDHILIGSDQYFSFREQGALDKPFSAGTA